MLAEKIRKLIDENEVKKSLFYSIYLIISLMKNYFLPASSVVIIIMTTIIIIITIITIIVVSIN